MITKPLSNEYLPTAHQYICLVPNGDLLDILRNQHVQSYLLLGNLSEEQAQYQYAEGKWTIKSVVGHIADVERLWNYRIFRIVRGDTRELPAYNRDTFAKLAPFDGMVLADVLEDLSAVRKSTLTLLGNLHEEALLRCGEYNDYSLSARAAAFIIAGHEIHHMNVIKSKYLSQMN